MEDIQQGSPTSSTESKSRIEQSFPSGSKKSKLKRRHSDEEAVVIEPPGQNQPKKRKTDEYRLPPSHEMTLGSQESMSPYQNHSANVEDPVDTEYVQQSQYYGTDEAVQASQLIGQDNFNNVPSSASTSFDANNNAAQYASNWPYNYMNNGTGIPLPWYHPPQVYPQVPFNLYDDGGNFLFPMSDYQQLFHNSMGVGQNVQMDQSGDGNWAYNQNSFLAQHPMTMSAPEVAAQQYSEGSLDSLTNVQTSIPGTMHSDPRLQPPITDNDGWEWVQHQQSQLRRNSAVAPRSSRAPTTTTYQAPERYFQGHEVPSTSV